MKNTNIQSRLKLDKTVFSISIITILAACIPIFLYPLQSSAIIQNIFNFTTSNFGFLFTWSGIVVIAICSFFAFSNYGNIVFGKSGETPEFNTFTWGAMLFTAGIAAALMYWGAIEWSYYYVKPPFGIESQSWQAAEWSTTYGIFHWGITAWSFYGLCALPIGYSYYVRNKPILKISEVCRGVLGSKVDGPIGKLIDILFILSLICGSATSLGVGVPMVSAGFCKLFGFQESLTINVAVLLFTTLLFSITGFLGLKKGIAKLSNINMFLSFAILSIVLVFGPTIFILKMTTTSIGLLLNNFIRMSTWMDPVLNTGFPEAWTQFYWAWWISYAPFMGLFIARISRGRSVKNVILGSIIFGGLGCASYFWILGNYGLNLQVTGKLDIVNLVSTKGGSFAIMEMLNMLPLGTIIILMYSICGVIFLATTFNSVSFTIAAVTTKEIKQDQEPNRYLVLFWAITLAILPIALLALNGPFSTLQAVTVIGAIPIIFIICIETISFIKEIKRDRN